MRLIRFVGFWGLLGLLIAQVTAVDERDRALVQQLDRVAARLDGIAAQLVPAPAPEPQPRARPGQPDPDAVYAVPIAGAPYRGAGDALVTMVYGGEFACPYCARVRPVLDELLGQYAGELKIVHEHYLVHETLARPAARAACAAQRQGRYFEMAARIWDEGFAERELGAGDMEALARALHLDLDAYRRDVAPGGPCDEIIARDQANLRRVGQRGTPSFYINGRFLSGARPIDAFVRLIDEELAVARGRVAGDRSARASYYQRWVLDRGLTAVE